MNPRQLATILAALRIYQYEIDFNGIDSISGMYQFQDGHDPLTTDEINTLCESLNCGDDFTLNSPTPLLIHLKEELTEIRKCSDNPGRIDWLARHAIQRIDKALPGPFQDSAMDLLCKLTEWAAFMGGFDAPVWQQAKDLLQHHDSIADTPPACSGGLRPSQDTSSLLAAIAAASPEPVTPQPGEDEPDGPRLDAIRALANDQHACEEIVIDSDAVVSESNDNGAYVAAWVWTDFSDTEFDKETEADDEAV